MLIQNYGLYWREEHVFWGRQKNPGRLLGVPARNVLGKIVDFREQVGVYALYMDHELVYVGQAGNGNQKLFARLRAHRRDHLRGRWNQFSWFGTQWVKQDGKLSNKAQKLSGKLGDVLDHLEAVLISAADPPQNSQGGRFGSYSIEYMQKRDDALVPSTDQMIEELWTAYQQSGT